MHGKIKKILDSALGRDSLSSLEIRVPDQESLGHYAANAAFLIAREEKKAPGKIAAELVKKIEKAAPLNFFEKVEATPNGFINFWLSADALRGELQEILQKKEKYGTSDVHKGKKIQVEFISANPTGPLTLANGRGGFFGDALANVLATCGGKVEREYYVNDTGNQIITLGKSVLAAAKKIPDEEKFYKGAYVTDWARVHQKEIKGSEEPLKLGQKVAAELFEGIRKAIEEKAQIQFDRWTSEEKEVRQKGFVEKALALFKKKELVYEAEGAVWLKTTEFGDDKDRVLITSAKYPTYFLADAGHFLETSTRGFKEKVLVLGPDHYGYVSRINVAAKLVGIKEFYPVVTQAVRLVEDGKEVKMSKRKGEFVTLEELIDEVGSDVARFFFLQVAPESHMDFDMGLAKEHSSKNPVYYVQYAYVRARKILARANYQLPISNCPISALTTEPELKLIRTLIQFPEFIEEASSNRRVHRLAHFAVAVARELHAFYEKERVIDAPEGEREARLVLVQGAVIVLENILTLLGTSKPEEM